jgi:pilus assembly protein Flp/PilA
MRYSCKSNRQAADPTSKACRLRLLAAGCRKFLRGDDGPTAVEYAVMLALIVVVCLSAIRTVGSKASTTFTNVAASIAGTSS